jgi:hypothetical protein
MGGALGYIGLREGRNLSSRPTPIPPRGLEGQLSLISEIFRAGLFAPIS